TVGQEYRRVISRQAIELHVDERLVKASGRSAALSEQLIARPIKAELAPADIAVNPVVCREQNIYVSRHDEPPASLLLERLLWGACGRACVAHRFYNFNAVWLDRRRYCVFETDERQLNRVGRSVRGTE